MKAILPIVAGLILGIGSVHVCLGGEAVILQEAAQRGGKAEGILLFIARDGRLVTDSGPTDEKALTATVARWRTSGTEPAIRLVLFPKLKSNSDLKAVRRIIDLLRANRVQYDIMLESVDAEPDQGLR